MLSNTCPSLNAVIGVNNMYHYLLVGVILFVGQLAVHEATEDVRVGQPMDRDVAFASSTLADWSYDIEEWKKTVVNITTSYKMDTAELYIKSTLSNETVVYWWQHSECDKCNLTWKSSLASAGNYSERLQTKYPNIIKLTQADSERVICSYDSKRLTDRGVYWLIVESSDCTFVLLNNPDNPDLAVLYAAIVLAGLAALWVVITILWKRGLFTRWQHRLLRCIKQTPHDASSDEGEIAGKAVDSNASSSEKSTTSSSADDVKSSSTEPGTAATQSAPAATKRRLKSLDSFRGLSLVIMIFVNKGGAGYWYFEHAVWNGLTVADLVFPWFIFIMGTSMAFSFRGLVSRKTPALIVVWRILWRSVKLFALGLFLGTKGGTDVVTMRIPGVLQRFSLTYLVIALVHYPFARRATSQTPKGQVRLRQLFGDLLPYWLEWIIHLAILGMFLALTYALPVPGCPTGYVGPGGLHEYGRHYNCTGGAAGYIDKVVLSIDHIYRWPTPQVVYKTTEPFDPEGILGTLASIFLCFLGLQSGKIVQQFKGSHVGICVRWTIWGLVTGGLALLLCGASVNDGWVPLNKNLWSVSYILAMASTAFLLLVVMYIIIDVFDLWNGAPFIYPGMNSIVIYFCQSAFSSNFPVSWIMPDRESHWQKLIVDLWSTSCWTFVAFVLYKKKIFVAL